MVGEKRGENPWKKAKSAKIARNGKSITDSKATRAKDKGRLPPSNPSSVATQKIIWRIFYTVD